MPTPLLQTMDAGSAAFASRWRSWASQFTQPQILRLASDYYGGEHLIHSSTISGFATRKLRRPAPQTFVAAGYLNIAHARSLNIPEESIEQAPDIGLPRKLPDHLRGFWEGREPLSDASRVVLGPTGLFEAFTGLRELLTESGRAIAPEDEERVCSALARSLRLRLAAAGVDWYGQLPELRTASPALGDLLMGKTLSGDRLLLHLPEIAVAAQTTDEELWAQIVAS